MSLGTSTKPLTANLKPRLIPKLRSPPVQQNTSSWERRYPSPGFYFQRYLHGVPVLCPWRQWGLLRVCVPAARPTAGSQAEPLAPAGRVRQAIACRGQQPLLITLPHPLLLEPVECAGGTHTPRRAASRGEALVGRGDRLSRASEPIRYDLLSHDDVFRSSTCGPG